MREGQLRTEAALKNSGLRLPHFKTIINLAPANLRKEGPSFDLPITIGWCEGAMP